MRDIVALGFLALSACGTAPKSTESTATAPKTSEIPEPSPAVPTAHHSLAIADATALPKCDAPAEGWLVYLKAEAKFQVCAAGSWVDIEIKGEKGDKGDPGIPSTSASSASDESPKIEATRLNFGVDVCASPTHCTVTVQASYSSGSYEPPSGLVLVASFAPGNTAPANCDGSSSAGTGGTIYIQGLTAATPYSFRACLFDSTKGTYTPGVTGQHTTPSA